MLTEFKKSGRLFVAALGIAFTTSAALAAEPELAALPLWPAVPDHVQAWWRHGFPGRVEGAPWHWCIRGGRWAFVLDTAAVQVPHVGPLDEVGYGAAGADDAAIDSLPAADLELAIDVNGVRYRCIGSEPWDGIKGPRIVESGRWLQRSDINGLVFESNDGHRLTADTRLEVTAWPDRLALSLAARPALESIKAGQASFGRVGGGFGFDGTNHLEVPHDPKLDPPEFTIEFWVYPPADFHSATKAQPWLCCKNGNEAAVGNFGITLDGTARPQARFKFGPGPEERVMLAPGVPLATEAWNHLAMSYDGTTLRLFINGTCSGEQHVGRPRVPGHSGFAFGRRQDGFGDGYHFKGIIDEVCFYDRAITADEVRSRLKKPEEPLVGRRPVRAEGFRTTGSSAAKRPLAAWNDASLFMRLTTSGTTLERRVAMPPPPAAGPVVWGEAAIAFDPATLRVAPPVDAVRVSAVALDGAGKPTGDPFMVVADDTRGWHRVSFDAVQPLMPPDSVPEESADRDVAPREPRNDALDRVRLTLVNPADQEQPLRLLLEKTSGGLRARGNVPITGVSALLRDGDGHPIGIPVQLSKNWHDGIAGEPYAGYWFHGLVFLRLPARATIDVEATIAHAHWGGQPAASHAQLSLCGWGSNQLWDQAAIGAWGETICFEPDQVQGKCSILDVRPLMVRSMAANGFWNWTAGVNGGDVFRIFDAGGSRMPHAGMTTTYVRQGPCLSEVRYAGRIGTGLRHSMTVSLARTNDLVRCVHRLRLDVDQPVDVSRFVIFQMSADTYGNTRERKMAVGDAAGLVREWNTQWGGDTYRTEPLECGGPVPWMSLHEAVRLDGDDRAAGAWANRGIVIREWGAKLGGHDAQPFVAERGVNWGNRQASSLDVLLPPDVKRLQPGDFVEAVVEQLVLPQAPADYYGPDEPLRTALAEMADTWRLVHREATGNERVVEVAVGRLERLHPDVRIAAADGRAQCTIRGGLGSVPITVTGLPSHRAGRFTIDGAPLDQQVHGNDFWQTDYDAATGTWSQTVTVPLPGDEPHTVRFGS